METCPEVGTPESVFDGFMNMVFRANPNGERRVMIFTEDRGWYAPSPEEYQEWLLKHIKQ